MSKQRARAAAIVLAGAMVAACGDTAPPPTPPAPRTADTCTYEALTPTAGAGETVATGPISAGVSEGDLGLPVGSALGGYTSRVALFGGDGRPDARATGYAGAFVPSAGIETRPRVKVLALTAGDETVVIAHVDVGAVYDGVLFEIERRLGPAFAGKVMLTASHTHGGPGHFVGNTILQLGFGAFRETSFEQTVSAVVSHAKRAIGAQVPASLGIAHDPDFDPDDAVSRDRRAANDDLPGGAARKDHDLFVVRVDTREGAPLAVLPVFGVHPTAMGADNHLTTTDVAGAIERAVEESFDREVLVMHLQQAAGDVAPAGTGGLACDEGPCYAFARNETIGRYARDAILAAWTDAGQAMVTQTEMEMVTRSVVLGPDLTRITARQGELRYLPFQEGRDPDGQVFAPDGSVASPIDEFNVAFGAGLCGNEDGRLGQGIPGATTVAPYQSCSRVEDVVNLLRFGIGDDWYFEDPLPSCASTETTLSALRVGEHVFISLPGEPLNPLVDRVRGASPVAAERTVVLGYAQDHVGYIAHADDWLRGGYEPSINVWGPIEGEYLAEQASALAKLVVTPEREDGAAGSRRARPGPFSPGPTADATPEAGTVPEDVPAALLLRPGVSIASAQPPTEVPRLDVAHFVWLGEDPLAGTPDVTLEREVDGVFVPVRRRSGRLVRDQDLLLFWTPLPLTAEAEREHYWMVEWQAARPWGDSEDDSLAGRANPPLGRYRFSVQGGSYQLTSEPFEVVPGVIEVSPEPSPTGLTLRLTRSAPSGYRLLDLEKPSNEPLPVADGNVTVVIEPDGASPLEVEVPVLDGVAEVALPNGLDRALVRVTDAFGNRGTGSLHVE